MTQSRTFVISGGTKGIGRATAERLIREGHRAIVLARKPPEGNFPGEFISVDFADLEQVRETLDRINFESPIDGVVNNVGLVKGSPVGSINLDDFQAVIDINLRSALMLTQTFLPGMKERSWGRIVNISSLTVLGYRERTSYAAAKSALISFTKTWSLELATSGITVNAVAPGPVGTELFRENNPVGSEGEARYINAVAMGRLGQPEEIAAAICFALSEDASFMTGQTLYIDGGASIGKQMV